MARYTLTRPSYLGDKYYAEGSTVDWDGPPNKAMVAVDQKGKAAPPADEPERHVASEVPMPGGDPPDPTWAPQTRPAFSVKTLREPNPGEPDKQASITRVAASAPTSGSAPPDSERPPTAAEARAARTVPDAKPAVRHDDKSDKSDKSSSRK